MRIYPLLAALLLGAAANAQEDETEKAWTFLLIVSGHPDFLQSTEISDAGAEALVEYARRGVEDGNKMGKENGQALCKDRGQLRTGKALAQRLEDDEAEWQAFTKSLADNMGVVLSAEDEAKVRYWIDHEFSPGFGPDFDLIYKIRTGQIDTESILTRACEPFQKEAIAPASEQT